jgi:hypothetical protein
MVIRKIKLRVFIGLACLLLLVASLFVVLFRAPKEADFKSTVPVSNIRPQLGSQLGPQSDLPSEINLPVPFFSQAPDANWGIPWQEACEEAASTLAVYYATGKPLSIEQFRADILGLVEWEKKAFGTYVDTTVDQTAQMIRGYFGFSDFEIVDNPTVDQMKRFLANGSVIVAPFSGKDLNNPFYSNGGPIYHMMVIRGYDPQNFITNDVGTKRGENFIYSYALLMETMHDWNTTDIHLGAKRVIVFSPVSN